MYAVIDAGGKQERVSVGERVDVELLRADPGDEVSLVPLLLVDGDDVVAAPDKLASCAVVATVLGETKGPKITGFTYKSKTRQSRRYGHRQRLTTLEIKSMTGPSAKTKHSSSEKS
jgi:large subunit ribosomal protein L21